jgi:ketol-acid reductoisomerase
MYPLGARYPLRNWSDQVFDSVTIIGSGRVGSAVAARLRERGVRVEPGGRLVLICVPDEAIAEVAAAIETGPWVGHVSGATPLAALEPHRRRFSLHPLQTFTRAR